MKKALLFTSAGVFAIVIYLASCAKMVAPSGGPKDVDPPVVVKSLPPQNSIFFKGKSIQITFNEYITLDKLNEKFMISPPMDRKPEISLRGKTLKIEFSEELKDSVTYTLYFQDAIRDLNEGNPLVNFQFVFSTGGYIDSLSVTGNVFMSYSLNPSKNVLVMLHSELADSAPRKRIPDYVTIASETGFFRINNVKPGKYRLYALSDNNNNKLYDLQDEAFAFYDHVIDVSPESNYLSPGEDSLMNGSRVDSLKRPIPVEGDYQLYLFTAPVKKYYLTSSTRSMQYKLVYTLSRPPDSLAFDFIADEKDKFLIEKNATGDTMTVWILDSLLWSQQEIRTLIKYPFTDSTDNLVYRTDTIPMRYFAVKPVRGKEKREILSITTNISGGFLKPGQNIMLASAIPLLEPDTSGIKLYLAEKDKRTVIPYQLFADTTDRKRYILKAKLAEEMRYQLITTRGAFRSIYGIVSDSAAFTFTVRPESSFGHLTVILNNGEGKMIVQLLDKSEKVIAEQKAEANERVLFPFLEKGTYRLRVIYDFNGDGRWNTGDYDLKLQPEPVSFYPDEIDVKTDWRIEQEWDVGRRNEKSWKLRDIKQQQTR